ncbi:XRE family transcriptional regulator [Tsukamurella soli]|uniref:HTH cro/C1-type domain-containing protein n=1 Tax=Tsukamurella soli TaxID=644556 RepID=A0ABP8JR69_9ACTN
MSPVQRREAVEATPRDRGTAEARPFADLLNQLFETVLDANGQPYTGKRVSAEANARGYTLSDAYISQLRAGRAKSPSYRTVEALACAFDVSVTHFLANPNIDGPRRGARRPGDDGGAHLTLSPDTARRITDLHRDLSVDTLDALIDLLHALRAEQSG